MDQASAGTLEPTLPEIGMDSVVLTDLLGPGLESVSGSVVSVGAGITGADATAEASIEVVEPLLVIEKTGPAAADPGDTVDYQLTVTNEGDGVAYDVTVADLLADPALTLVPGSVTATLDGVPVAAVPGADGFSVTLPVVMPGSVLVVSCQATLEPDAAPASQYVNTATVDYDSVPGTDPANPGRDGTDSDDHVLGSSPVVTKAAIATSIAETASDQHDPALPDLTWARRSATTSS